MLDQETKTKIDNARDILVGKVPDPKSQIEQITAALIYKFMDDMDAQKQAVNWKASFLVDDLAPYTWKNLMSPRVSGSERWELYTRALSEFGKSEHVPELFRTIFSSVYVPFRDPQTLNLFLKQISEFSYDHSEKLGDAYEYLLSILGSQGDAGQFRTPRHIIDFMVEVVSPKKNETILDPACGTAGFLISAYKHIIKANSRNYNEEINEMPFVYTAGNNAFESSIQNNGKYKGDQLTPDDRQKIASNITGYDIAPEMRRLSLVNLYLHDFKNPQIHEYDTLTNDERWDDSYDVIFANPPFMTPRGGIQPHQKFTVQANRSEVLFVDYIAEHLNVNGRAAIIVPEGIIFQRANAYKMLRKNLIDNWGLYAVVSLPSGVFNPYSGVKTSILLIDKVIAKTNEKILFIKIKNDGFDLGSQRRKIEKNDLGLAYQALKSWQENTTIPELSENLCHVANKEAIAQKEYDLTGSKYFKQTDNAKTEWPTFELGRICEIYQPKTITKQQLTNDGKYKVFGANGVIGYFDEFNHAESEIAITCRGATCGTVNFTDPKSWITGNAMVVKPKDNNLNKKYLFQLLRFSDLTSTITGAAQPQITRASLHSFEIPVPPIEIQEQIAAKIDEYSKIIDASQNIIMYWKPNFKINPNWPIMQLDNFCTVAAGNPAPQNSQLFKNGKHPFFRTSDVGAVHLSDNLLKTRDHLNDSGIANLKLFKKGTILFPKSGASTFLNHRVIMGTDGYVSSHLATIFPDENKANSKFVYYSLIYIDAKLLTSDQSYPSLKTSSIAKIEISLPNLEIQDKIVREIEAEQKIIYQCKTLIEKMKNKIEVELASIWEK